MSAKRILFLTPQLPYPPHQGTALRNYGLIKGLADRGHHVGLMSFVEDGQPGIDMTPLAEFRERTGADVVQVPARSMRDRLRDLVMGHADMTRRLWSEIFYTKLQDWLKRQDFDVIHIEGIEMAPYLPAIREAASNSPFLIYDAHNCEYALQRRIALQDLRNPRRWHVAAYSVIQSMRLTAYETRLCREVDHVLAVSEADAESLRRLKHRTPVTVAPNAISVDEYRADGQPDVGLTHNALVFTGKMDFRPNVDAALWFADEILPLIQTAVPDANFVIVGKNPHARLDRLRAREDVTITGFVDDVQPYIVEAAAYVAPLRMGSGTRFKLLEAMALSKAIVSTRIGAEGLDVTVGEHVLLGDSPEEFAQSVVRLLKDGDLRAQLAERAKERVRAQYDWSSVIPIVEDTHFREH